MKLAENKQAKRNYIRLAFLLPFFSYLLLMIIRGFTPFGHFSTLYCDSYHQYYPFFKAFRKAILSGNGLIYSWNVGLGMDYLGLIAYYLASPLNLLSIFIPESWLLPFFTLLTPVRISLASLFFAIMLKNLFRKNDFSITLFGIFYGTCAWVMGYFWNVMWMDTFALLPLVVLGTVWLLRDKKFILYTFTLFLSIVSNYYIGLFTCIFVLLFFICYQICRCTSFRRFWADLFRIAFFSFLAIAMTMFLELPALAALQNTQSSVNKFPEGFRLNIADEPTWQGLLTAMGRVASNMGGGTDPTFKEGLPNLYCGVGTVLLGTLFLTDRKISVRSKICSVFLLLFFNVSFIIRQLDYIWHGFHFTNMIPYRFSFLYSFVLLFMAYSAWIHRKRYCLWQLLLAGIFSLCVFSISENIPKLGDAFISLGTIFSDLGSAMAASLEGNRDAVSIAQNHAAKLWEENNEPILYVLYNGVFLIAYFTAFLFPLLKKKPKKDASRKEISAFCQARRHSKATASRALLAIMCIELGCNLLNFGIRFPATDISWYPKGTEDTRTIVNQMKNLEKETLFYRAETTHTQTLNDGALLGYNGVSAFTSSANVHVTEFMKTLGYSAKNTYNRYCFEDGSPVANLFLGIKYMIEREPVVKDNPYFSIAGKSGNITLLKNSMYLPLGFLADSELGQQNFFATVNPIDQQNEIFRSATGIAENVWHTISDNYVQISSENADVKVLGSDGYCTYKNCSAGSKIIYTFRPNFSGVMCVNFDLTDRNSYSVYKNDIKLYSEGISLPQLISVGYVESGDCIKIELSCKKGEDGNMTIRGAVLDDEIFKKGYEILSASQLNLSRFSSTQLRGSISCNRNGLLYTSIPQNGNWYVTVDDTPAEITLIGNTMVGVNLSAGQHEIRFQYRNKAFSLGLYISLICSLIFWILVAIVIKDLHRQGKRLIPRKNKLPAAGKNKRGHSRKKGKYQAR